MPYLELQGIRRFYERYGDGNPPLVFVHGYACSHEDWQPHVDFFRTRQSVITCDLRGHGASDGAPDHCSIETFGADLSALLRTLDLQPAILIGHSMGCRVVLQGYLDAPQRVAGLIRVEGSRFAAGDPQVAEQTAQHMLQAVGYTTIIRRLFDDMFLEGSAPALKERILRRALALPEEIGDALFPRVCGWDARTLDRALSQIAVPLLVLQSTDINPERVRVPLHPGVTTPWLELIQQHVPTAWIEIISGVGHFAMLEAPEAVHQPVATFVAKVAPGERQASSRNLGQIVREETPNRRDVGWVVKGCAKNVCQSRAAPNKGVQATAYSLRFAALRSGFQPRLTPGVRLLR